MAQEIQVFENPSFGEIRTAGTSEKPLFCLADVCNAIGIKDVSRCASRLDDDMRQTHPIEDRMGRVQQATFVTESGLYDVIIRSDSERAKPFRRWVTSEVLPSIRRTGSYSANKAEEPAQIPLRDKITWVKEVKKLLNLNDASTLGMLQQVGVPLGLPMPEYVPSKGVLHSATELLKKHGLTISAKIFNQKAIEAGFLARMFRKSSKGDKPFNVITEKGKEYGENQVNPKNPRSTQPLWYDDKFAQMLEEIGI